MEASFLFASLMRLCKWSIFDDHFADARKMVDVPISLPDRVQHGLFRIHGIPVRWLYG